MKLEEPRREVLVDGLWGIYVPQRFATVYSPVDWNVLREDWNILLAGPDHSDYWDVWSDVLDGARYIDRDNNTWVLEQDGDLFAVVYD